MKRITVKIESDKKDDNQAVPISVEEDRGAGWIRVDGRDFVTNKDGEAAFVLKFNQRLVIDTYTAAEVETNRDQFAAFQPQRQMNPDGLLDSPLHPDNLKEVEALNKWNEDAEKARREGKNPPPALKIESAQRAQLEQPPKRPSEPTINQGTQKAPAAAASKPSSTPTPQPTRNPAPSTAPQRTSNQTTTTQTTSKSESSTQNTPGKGSGQSMPPGGMRGSKEV